MKPSRMPSSSPKSVTVQVLDGVDKGRVFRDLPVPLTIGREEGNLLRLNDERVSRFHAKVQLDGNDLVLTDLESTNGTRVNGHVVQIRRLRFGDRITVGRSLLLFGSDEEINQRKASLLTQQSKAFPGPGGTLGSSTEEDPQGPPTLNAQNATSPFEEDVEFDLNLRDEITSSNDGEMKLGRHILPPLPQKLTPSQAARLAEILDFLHFHLTRATDNIQANEDGTQVALSFAEWQSVLAVQKLLARYLRAIAEPDALHD